MNRIISNINFGDINLEYSVVEVGTPILMFHGGHSNCNEELGYQVILNAGFSIITPSRIGYGKTSYKRDYDIKNACEIYRKLLIHLKIDKVHVIGVSAGGPSSICFSSMFPECVESLVLQSSVTKSWLTPSDKEYKIGKIIFSPKMEKFVWKMVSTLSNLFPRFMFKNMFSSFSNLSLKSVKNEFDQNSIEEFKKMNNRYRSNHGFMIDLDQTSKTYEEELLNIQCPVLVMHSKNDNAVTVEHAEYVKSIIPHADLYIQNSWGHLIWIGKHASEYNEKLISFLTENMPR